MFYNIFKNIIEVCMINENTTTISIDMNVHKKLKNYCKANKIKSIKTINSYLKAYTEKPKNININYNLSRQNSTILIDKELKEKLSYIADDKNMATKTLLEEIILSNIK